MKKAGRATQFSRDLCADLKNMKLGLKWRTNDAPAGCKNESVDVVGGPTERDFKVLIEVELRRANPVSNVAKIWRWAADNKLGKKFFVFHALSRNFREHPNQKKNAEFVGKQMSCMFRGVVYKLLNVNYLPHKGSLTGGGRRRKAARRLAARIKHHLRRNGWAE